MTRMPSSALGRSLLPRPPGHLGIAIGGQVSTCGAGLTCGESLSRIKLPWAFGSDHHQPSRLLPRPFLTPAGTVHHAAQSPVTRSLAAIR
ncbi:hypothetical protein BJX64DRAFT_253977 [Aspergillus heterothallicus]